MFFKMHVEAPGISYEDAVEEALCFGWVDSIVRSIDADRYEQRFTPRRSGSRWSKPNVQRMKKLIASGRVTTAGQAAFAGHERRVVTPHPAKLPAELEHRFRKTARAWQNFHRFPASYQRVTIGWVASAQREETRLRRLCQLMEASARNQKIGFSGV